MNHVARPSFASPSSWRGIQGLLLSTICSAFVFLLLTDGVLAEDTPAKTEVVESTTGAESQDKATPDTNTPQEGKPGDGDGTTAAAKETAETPQSAEEDSSPETKSTDATHDKKTEAESDTASTEKDAAEKDNTEEASPKDKKPARPFAGMGAHPLSEGIIALLPEEIGNGFRQRNIESKFGRFRGYAAGKLNATAGAYTGSEITGNCRLRWYNYLLRNPMKAPEQAESFTRVLHDAARCDHEGLDAVVSIATDRLDLEGEKPRTLPSPKSPAEALDLVEQSLVKASACYAAALAPLSRSEIGELSRNLYQGLTGQGHVGHTFSDRSSARRMCDLLEKMDRSAVMSGARAFVPLTDTALLDELGKLPAEGNVSVTGVTGTVVGLLRTPSGDIVIGGRGDNSYRLDEIPGLLAVIDLGGDDSYSEGVCNYHRPVLAILDLGGDDSYRGSKPGVQGAANLGFSIVVDRSGDDVYQAKDVAQGSCVGGVGMLVDLGGNDTYVGVRRAQGEAIGGIGLLIDRGGNDRYHAAMWAQGFGGPLGFGLLEDSDGADHYFAGGLYPDSYEETPGYEGWSQGLGAGIRQVANGGIGVILDGGGDDIYEFDYLAHGGGYWLGMGFARDFGGNDKRLGATRTAYNGGARTEQRFQRFGCGFGCHYALGFCIDDRGNDSYNGTIMGTGFAWDVAFGMLVDLDGQDQYLATGGGTQGNGAQAGLGILFDYAGNDYYRGYGQGRASSSISYHDLPYCGGNFSFVIDYGGTDRYGCGARNNSYNMRSSSGGFLIDRPKDSETKETQESAKHGRSQHGTAGTVSRRRS